jgi:hypothetical protein
MFRQQSPSDSRRYKVVVDAYPQLSGPLRNFQLTRWITGAGQGPGHCAAAVPPVDTVDGYRFAMQGKPKPPGDSGELPEPAR